MSRLPGPPLWEQGLSGLRMRRDPLGELMKLYERYGPVIATGAGPLKYVWLLGPDAHRELFVDIERFSWREVTKPIMVVDGETAVVLSDGEDHERRRRRRRWPGYQPLLNSLQLLLGYRAHQVSRQPHT